MTFFDPETIRIGCAVSRAVTDARTRRTREALARGETPDLVGALTPADLLRWIEKRKPFHLVPVTSRAMAESDLYRRPSYSNPSSSTFTTTL